MGGGRMAEKVSRTYRFSPELATALEQLKVEMKDGSEGRDLGEFVEAAIWTALSERSRRRVVGGGLMTRTPRVQGLGIR